MPTGEDYASAPVVTVNGRLLPEQAAGLLTEAYVDDSLLLPAMAVLRFSDPHDEVLGKANLGIGTEFTLAVKSSQPGAPVPLIQAAVTAIEREIDSRGAYLIVRGLDGRRKLQGGATVATYVKQKASDIARTVAGRAGLACEIDPIGPLYEHLMQPGISDWDFLTQLAADHDAVLSMTAKTLHFKRPTAASTAPAGASDPHVITVADHVLTLRSTVTASAQVPSTTARGWDPVRKQTVTATANAATTSASVASTPAKLGKQVAAHIVGAPEWTDQKQAQGAAEATMASRAGSFAELEAQVRGNSALHAGEAITLQGAGTGFDGKYVLTAVRHVFDPVAGYVTEISVAGTSERSGYGVVAGGEDSRPTHDGVLPAVVTNLKDPQKQGRVKVRFPTLDETQESWWARVVHAGAGAQRGTVLLPEVGDEVLVAFAGSGMSASYVLGGLYNGKDQPLPGFPDHVSGQGKVIRRGFTSRTGMTVEMLEDASSAKLTIATKNAEQRLTLTQSPQGGIEIVSQGPIDVTAQGAMNLEAKQKLSLTGMEVAITAKQKLSLSGMDVALDAQNGATVAGTKVDVDSKTALGLTGKAKTDLTSSGMVTVRGSLVKIN